MKRLSSSLFSWLGKVFEPLPVQESGIDQFEEQVRQYCATVDSLTASLKRMGLLVGEDRAPKRHVTAADIPALVDEAYQLSSSLVRKWTVVPATPVHVLEAPVRVFETPVHVLEAAPMWKKAVA
jgi:hypothetical protein